MNTLKIIIVAALLFLTSACSYNTYSSGESTSEPVSYLYFTGNIAGASVVIDDAAAFNVILAGSKNQYKVTPGKHTITISKGGNVVVKRSVLLGDGHEKEINIP